jgi:glycerophosphoryl diester phosphodiesterase
VYGARLLRKGRLVQFQFAARIERPSVLWQRWKNVQEDRGAAFGVYSDTRSRSRHGFGLVGWPGTRYPGVRMRSRTSRAEGIENISILARIQVGRSTTTTKQRQGVIEMRRRLVASLMAITGIVVCLSLTQVSGAVASIGIPRYGHRGNIAMTPENSRAGIASAIKNGAYGIEFDVRFTRTGYPVVMHDSSMKRTTTCTSSVVEKITTTKFKSCLLSNKEHAPSLYEFLKYGNSKSTKVRYELELKTVPTTAQGKLVLNRLDSFSMRSRVRIISFKTAALDKMKSLGWKGSTGYIFTTPSGWSSKYPYLLPYCSASTSCVGVSPTKALVVAAHAKGKKILVGVGNDAGMQRVRDLGIDSISVNDVAWAVNWTTLSPTTTTTTTTSTTISTTVSTPDVTTPTTTTTPTTSSTNTDTTTETTL